MSRRITSSLVVSLRFLCTLTVVAALLVAQEVPAILQVDVENWVAYVLDVNDLSRLAKTPTPVAAVSPTNFGTNVSFADVVAINGSPAKGVMVMQNQTLALTPSPSAGQAISDLTRATCVLFRWEFMKPDGSPIGSIFAMGLAAGASPPGSPLGSAGGNNAILGGTGAFIGARGTLNAVQSAGRSASQTEDPSMRRVNGGGQGRFLLQVWPMSRPEVLVTSAGPGVFHADYSPVTAGKPAQRGETLIVHAKGLGPTLPGVNSGDPFPATPFAIVTSPVEVLVDGKAAPAINQLGIPDAVDTYRIDFRVPDNAGGGMVPLQISAAWIKGNVVQIPVR